MTPEEEAALVAQMGPLPPVGAPGTPGAAPALPAAPGLNFTPNPNASVPGAVDPTLAHATPASQAASVDASALASKAFAAGDIPGSQKAQAAVQAAAQGTPDLAKYNPAPLAPVGPKGGAGIALPPGASGVDLGLQTPRGGGASPKIGAAMAADQAALAASNQKEIGAYSGAQDEAAKAAQEHEDVSINNLAGVQSAQDAATTIQTTRDQNQQKAIARQQELADQRAADLAKIKDIDPEHYWNSQSTGDKVRMSIAAALGAIGQGLSKSGSNPAMDLLHSAISRDVEAQKANVEKASKSAAAKAEMAKEEMTRSQWVDQQLQSKQVMGYEMAQKMAAAQMATATSAEAKAKAQDYIAGIEAKKQAITQGAIQQDMARLQAQQVAAGAPSAADAATQKLLLEQAKTIAAERAKNGQAPLTASEMRTMVLGQGAKLGGGALPGTVGAAGTPADRELAKKELEKQQASKDAGATVDAQAQGLKSTALFSNPSGFFSQHVQNTEGDAAARARDAYNIGVHADIHQKAGIRGAEDQERVGKAMMIQPGDSQTTIDRKVAARKQWLQSLGATPSGAAAGLPGGAREAD